MNTNLIIGILAGVIVLGGGAYFMMNTSAGKEAGTASQSRETAQEDGAFTGSLAQLAARGGEWKCTVDSRSQTDAVEASTSGVVYVSGNKVRADLDVSVSQLGAVKTHMIADGTYVYSWSSMTPQGMRVEQADDWGGDGLPASGESMGPNMGFSYDCEPASVDASLFTPPADMTFSTL